VQNIDKEIVSALLRIVGKNYFIFQIVIFI